MKILSANFTVLATQSQHHKQTTFLTPGNIHPPTFALLYSTVLLSVWFTTIKKSEATPTSVFRLPLLSSPQNFPDFTSWNSYLAVLLLMHTTCICPTLDKFAEIIFTHTPASTWNISWTCWEPHLHPLNIFNAGAVDRTHAYTWDFMLNDFKCFYYWQLSELSRIYPF